MTAVEDLQALGVADGRRVIEIPARLVRSVSGTPRRVSLAAHAMRRANQPCSISSQARGWGLQDPNRAVISHYAIGLVQHLEHDMARRSRGR